MSDSPYHGDAIKRVANATPRMNELGKALDNLIKLHRTLSAGLENNPNIKENIGLRTASGRALDTSNDFYTTNIAIDVKLLLSIVEMDIVRTLAALNESAQQIITATQTLPRIEVVDEIKNAQT